ncbi:MAG: C25 family cysteine peptidase, partial [Candidatus Methylomirabilales bacterium]
GWYRVAGADLLAAGLAAAADAGCLRLYSEGREVPVVIEGGADGKLDGGDSLGFYGAGLDTPSTARRVYWLAEGTSRRAPPKPLPLRPRAGGPSRSFPFTVERRERAIYFAALRNGEAENFFGPVVAGEAVEEVVEVHHLDREGKEGLLEVELQGVTEAAHAVRVVWNGRAVGRVEFSGQRPGALAAALPLTALREGPNAAVLVAEGGELDVSLLASVRLTYPHTYSADEGVLRFGAQGGEPVVVEGFASRSVLVFDVTDPFQARRVAGKVERQGEGFSVRLWAPGSGERVLLALERERSLRPLRVEANRPSRWSGSREGAELVMISPRGLQASLEPLVALREGEGLQVAVIDVEDLYDEYSFGHEEPGALRAFLHEAASRWERPPRWALLVGDASFDPKGYLGVGGHDLVPTKLLDSEFLETASDGWFGDFDLDGVPEVAVGRLPVRSVEEAERVVGKIVAHAGAPVGGWMRQALLVADDNDLIDFEAASAGVEG